MPENDQGYSDYNTYLLGEHIWTIVLEFWPLARLKITFQRERKEKWTWPPDGMLKEVLFGLFVHAVVCHSCWNSVKDNYFKCNEMSALMQILPNTRSITPQKTVTAEPSAITALSGNCPQIFETFLELTNKCWFGLAGCCLVSLAGTALQWMALLCCSNSFAFLLKFPSTSKRKTDSFQLLLTLEPKIWLILRKLLLDA